MKAIPERATREEQKIKACLWFDGCAEEAAQFYTAVFPQASITSRTPGPDGKALVLEFRLEGQDFIALNGGPMYRFSPAISLFVSCDDQAEVDALWKALAEGGEIQQCGWLRDRFGVSWQIIPRLLMRYLQDQDRARSSRVMQAMLGMTRIDVAALERAARV